MNSSDWIGATGTAVIGRGPFRRPVNPRLLAAAMGKAALSTRTRHSAAWRKQQLELARLSAPVDLTPRRRAVRDTSIFEQSRPGAPGQRAMLQHARAVQLARW